MIAAYARPYLRFILLVSLVLLLWDAGPVFGQGVDFSREKARGYFFYERIEEIEPAPPPKVTPAAPTTPAAPKAATPVAAQERPFSVAWLREQMPKVRDAAIDNPTTENLTAYRYLQRVMLDKSSQFEEAWSKSLLSEPLLDENLRRPISTYGGNALDESARKGFERAVAQLAKQAGLWFFFRSDCDFCHAQAPILKALADGYGFKVLAISLDGKPLPGNLFPKFEVDRGQAAAWGVMATPALFLVRPGTREHVEISQGLITMDEVLSRAVKIAGNAGWLDERMVAATRPVRPTYAPTATLADIPANTADDPKALAQYLRDALRTPRAFNGGALPAPSKP